VACSCCDFTGPAGQQFNAKKAAKQLKGYRRGAVPPTTRMLRDGVVAAGLNHGALLDVGAGIGALTFELLERGMSRAVAVEASRAYLDTASEEAARRRRSEVITFCHGDFAGVGPDLPAAEVVTLDRVVCCYPDYKSLLAEALRHARNGLALSYPRDRWFVRLGVRIENALRALGSTTFRTFVHPVEDMQRSIREAGFELVSRSQTAAWAADTYVRRHRGTQSTNRR
jgi:SAM-dependent methyltransferase